MSLVAPVGISFYSIQMITYLADLYSQKVKAERNLVRYALFTSFFPTLCSGPIERAKHFLPQTKSFHIFQYRQVKNGLLLMMWGFFQKLVISDRIAIFVNEIYGQWHQVLGYLLMIATFLYAFQIYCDFSGYSDIAIGAAQVLGFQVTNNFHQPYFSRSVAEFWRRWHISLSSWFRDYIYIPLGGNRHGKWVQYRNILIVFIISGLWHGASWNFIVWGGIHGIFQIVENFSMPMRNKLKEIAKIKTDCFSYHFFQTALTFFAVDFAWIFFRAPGAKTALHIIKKMLSPEFSSFHIEELFHAGLNKENFCVLFVSLILLLIVDLFRHNQNIRQFIEQQNLPFRWLIYYCGIFSIIIFGIYGPGYDASTFVYMQF